MLDPSRFREVVSGRRRGWKASLLRMGFRWCEIPYALVMNLRNRRFDKGQAKSFSVDVPVISVGNLTLGGTGKTPLVEWICRRLRKSDIRVSIVSRGYGAGEEGRNDEALELELALPDVPHLQNPDRVLSAQIAIEELLTQAIVLDDGFQHRRLQRDLDIVLLDATEPFGYEHVFPRGTLREPLRGLARADVVVLSRADMVDDTQREAIHERALQLSPSSTWCEVVHAPDALINSLAQTAPIDSLQGENIAAFCAIGNPAGFRHTLETLGAEVTKWREFPDHYRFGRDDIQSLVKWSAGAERVVCTRKDLVKLQIPHLESTPLWALGVKVDFLAGQQEFQNRLALVADSVNHAASEESITSAEAP